MPVDAIGKLNSVTGPETKALIKSTKIPQFQNVERNFLWFKTIQEVIRRRGFQDVPTTELKFKYGLSFRFFPAVSVYNKRNFRRWLKDINFMFSWQKRDYSQTK